MKKENIAYEIEGRIRRHISHSKQDYEVYLIWRGYIAALLEWGKISAGEHDDLRDLLQIKEKNENDMKNLFLDVDE
jgi:hypothetical protein